MSTAATNGSLAWLSARPIAHRGLHDAANGIIENTGPAVSEAISAGYAIEVDLRLSSDGEAMVFHDPTLDRLTEEHGPVSARASSALKWVRFKGTDARMMTLGELIAQVEGQLPLFLEIKSQWDNVGPLEKRVAQILRNYEGQVAVMSFDPNSLAVFQDVAPTLPRGIVAERFRDKDYWSGLGTGQRFMMRHLLTGLSTKPHFIAYDINGLPSLAPLFARYLLAMPLLTWTVRTPAQRRRAKWLADAMIFEGFRP
jgi:glycerophosphoryl diester phosphodiesterase